MGSSRGSNYGLLSRERQEGRQNCILMSLIFQRQAETFLEREEAKWEDAELSPMRFGQSREPSRLFSGEWP